ncbi:angiopoietin-2-like [Mytilus trossulus]|uniref:angiopoietin-2-like n=1 Tax=Mytilus trossulus TaxID=6551 RepID=UPI0030064F20
MLLPDISYAIFVLNVLVRKSLQSTDVFHVVTGSPPGNEYLIAEKETTRSKIHCASWCTMTVTCNSAVFNSTTMHCGLYRESQSANSSSSLAKQLILQRDETEDNETIVSEITRENTTKFDITSERATLSVSTSERTTNHATTMDKITSPKPTSNELDMTSQEDTISGTTSKQTTNHGTTMEKLTSPKPTSNGLDMTSRGDSISDTTSERTATHGTTMEKLTSQNLTSNGLNMTSQRATINGTTSERTTTHSTTIENLTSQKQTSIVPHDCSDVSVGNFSGVYTIYIDNQPLDVYCEMTDSGQWTVFQRRMDGSTDFYRTWQEYQQGFGNVHSEYWLGDSLTSQDLRYPPNGYEFSTLDRDNDGSFMNCAKKECAGWWFNFCTEGNLNGKYYNGGMIKNDGIYWEAWKLSKYSLRSVSMKIKQV